MIKFNSPYPQERFLDKPSIEGDDICNKSDHYHLKADDKQNG